MMPNNEPAPPAQSLVMSYLELRRAIGVLGFILPFLVWFGGLAFGFKLQPTISDYYHTPMRDYFVGVMCAIGIFLFCYKGYDWLDDWMGNLACISALGVALLPTAPLSDPTPNQVTIGHVHTIAAGLFFFSLALFSLFRFPKTAANAKITPIKKKRNWVYVICGLLIVGCVSGIGYILIVASNELRLKLFEYHTVFWLESTAVWAFSISWLTKGQFLLRD